MAVSPIDHDVETVARLERQSLERRSPGERLSDAIVSVVGTLWFTAVHLVAVALWVLVNVGAIPGVRPFDPFPFGVLTLVVSAEGVFLALFILVSQNRMMRMAEDRAHLHLQVSALAEHEATKMLQMLEAIHLRLGLGEPDEEARALADETELGDLAEKLSRELPHGHHER
jgi:uncharacterized membrane protein